MTINTFVIFTLYWPRQLARHGSFHNHSRRGVPRTQKLPPIFEYSRHGAPWTQKLTSSPFSRSISDMGYHGRRNPPHHIFQKYSWHGVPPTQKLHPLPFPEVFLTWGTMDAEITPPPPHFPEVFLTWGTRDAEINPPHPPFSRSIPDMGYHGHRNYPPPPLFQKYSWHGVPQMQKLIPVFQNYSWRGLPWMHKLIPPPHPPRWHPELSEVLF